MPKAGASERRGWVVMWWPPVLSVVLVWPLLSSPGYPLARDLVFVPHQAFTWSTWGLGEGPPRAVPLDAVVSSLTSVLDGGLVARLILPLILALAGWGVLSLLPGRAQAARWAASGLAVWNPYVVERLALGQWAVLAAYAALPWLVGAAARYRESGRRQDLGGAVLWASLASLTPTGGLLALAGIACAACGRSWRWVHLLVAGSLIQLPWLVAALTGSSVAGSDPRAIALFAPDTQAASGPIVAVLGLGGIWDDASEPATRATVLALVAASVTVTVLIAGGLVLPRLVGHGVAVRWFLLAGLAGSLVLLGATACGQDVLRWMVASVPGAGLVRDSQKFLAPVALLTALCGGALAHRVAMWAGTFSSEVRTSALLPLVALPLLLLPDATTVTWPTLQPVRYPGDFAAITRLVERGPEHAGLVTLPWRSYRAFSWGSDRTSSDPAVRWFPTETVVDDRLQVGEVLLRGENPRAAAVTAALRVGPPAQVLGPLGITWVVVYPDDPAADSVSTAGLLPVYQGQHVQLYRVPGSILSYPGPSAARIWAVGLAWAFALLTLLAGLLLRLSDPLQWRRSSRARVP